jgi:hypothetical protein
MLAIALLTWLGFVIAVVAVCCMAALGDGRFAVMDRSVEGSPLGAPRSISPGVVVWGDPPDADVDEALRDLTLRDPVARGRGVGFAAGS